MRAEKLRSHCPIHFWLEAFGDKWTLLILRDIVFRGKKTYGEFSKSEEKFATNILASRLELLETEKVLVKQPDPEDARRSYYLLTEKGIDLVPVLFEMMVWSEKYDSKSEAARAKRLMSMIRANSRTAREAAQKRLRKGLPLFPEFLD